MRQKLQFLKYFLDLNHLIDCLSLIYFLFARIEISRLLKNWIDFYWIDYNIILVCSHHLHLLRFSLNSLEFIEVMQRLNKQIFGIISSAIALGLVDVNDF